MSTTKGRSPNGTRKMTFKFSEELAESLEAAADRKGINMTEFLRRALILQEVADGRTVQLLPKF